ncbi:MAG TPA: HAD family phosphatase, partial [Oligoflexia bacterium]|nr:HAD family phosphatase [Oligoflexia bacterium]
TQKLHSAVESEVLGCYGIEISPEEVTQKFAGMPSKDFFRSLLGDRDNADALCREMIRWKWEKLLVLDIEPVPGAAELIERLHGKYKLAVASSSSVKFVEHVLHKLGLRAKFPVITGIEEVSRGKPDPEIFLLTAKKLDSPPGRCVVIEDALHGMSAAKRAGMKCIGLTAEAPGAVPADLVVRKLNEINESVIGGL